MLKRISIDGFAGLTFRTSEVEYLLHLINPFGESSKVMRSLTSKTDKTETKDERQLQGKDNAEINNGEK